ncbi:hypothetical protein [Wolbachia endosymbiont (group A) of Limnophora tigrina]|uniref:hypothetical protein n=1 Tax=Wolbachia endosymbiont (group A) of Limnophora tigrina TaxID=3139318 RepID=UPI0035B50455
MVDPPWKSNKKVDVYSLKSGKYKIIGQKKLKELWKKYIPKAEKRSILAKAGARVDKLCGSCTRRVRSG